MKKTTYTTAEKKAYFAEKRKNYLEALKLHKAKIESQPDKFVCYNAFTGRVYSLGNHCFIAYMGGEAGAYASFLEWKKRGYRVKAKTHGVTICQPIIKKEQNKEGNDESKMVNVSYSTVFHYSSVEPVGEETLTPVVEAIQETKPATTTEVKPIDKEYVNSILQLCAF